ncbi:MAG: hypothetical protein DDT34_01334 [Firmicutes bacterium]|nr:hypothetical protein [Bacillota bacterium]
MSQKSTVGAGCLFGGIVTSVRCLPPRNISTNSPRESTAKTSSDSTNRASKALALGKTSRLPACWQLMAMGSTPCTGRSMPSRDNSPTKTASLIEGSDKCSDAASNATAMERSKPEPSLRKSAGARLTVMRRVGIEKPQFFTAARTLSFASRTARSGRPTMSKLGSPGATSTSTSTK